MRQHFGPAQSMDVNSDAEALISRIALAIGEPARTRMLMSLLDGRARTSTELATAADVAPSTASIHLNRLREDNLVKVAAEGRYRYYELESRAVACALEKLSVLAGRESGLFRPSTPEPLRNARTCYDHIAGTFAVALHDHFLVKRWLQREGAEENQPYDLTTEGEALLRRAGVNVDWARAARRRFAFACLDWSERRPHIAGSLGSALLAHFVERKWIVRDLEGRALSLTSAGKRGLSREWAFNHDSDLYIKGAARLRPNAGGRGRE